METPETTLPTYERDLVKAIPPDYESAVYDSNFVDRVTYRLYIQYNLRSVHYIGPLSEKLKANGGITIITYGPAVATFIKPISVPINQALQTETPDELYTIVIQSANCALLHKVSELCTSYEFWKNYSHISREFELVHTSTDLSIHCVIADTGQMDRAVSLVNSVKILNTMCQEFFEEDLVEEETKYSLHVKFKKSDIAPGHDKMNKKGDIVRRYSSPKPPFFCEIFEDAQYDPNDENIYSGAALELVFKSSTFEQLVVIRDDYLDMCTPGNKTPCQEVTTIIHPQCVESYEDSSSIEKVVVSGFSNELGFFPTIVYRNGT